MSLLVKMPLQKKLNKKIILFKKKLEKQEKNWKKIKKTILWYQLTQTEIT
jgi:hypothetical protein